MFILFFLVFFFGVFLYVLKTIMISLYDVVKELSNPILENSMPPKIIPKSQVSLKTKKGFLPFYL